MKNKVNRMLFVLMAILLIAPAFFSVEATGIESPQVQQDDTLVVGTGSGPVHLDCVYAWDSASSDVYDQVIEGLYQYDLTDPNLAIKPMLASDHGTWSNEGTTYTVPIRTGVTFHDGTPFNASAAKWNFDRLAFFMNISGDLPEGEAIVQTHSLYEFGDGTPIINNTVADDVANTLTFNLNRPYGAFQALLCFGSSWIQSPTSTPMESYVNTTTGMIYGTGPYVYDYYTPDVEVVFYAYDDYWNEAGKAKIPNLVYKIIEDGPSRMQALLDGDFDILPAPLPEYLWQFYQDDVINVTNPGPNLATAYLGMNCEIIPKYVRHAISFAFDYDYCIEEIYNGYAYRMESPVPQGIIMSDYSSEEAKTNLTKARLAMQKAGYGTDLDVSDDAAWQEVEPFLTFNYTYNIDNQIRADLLVLLQNSLGKIGIEVTDAGMEFSDFIYRLYDVSGFSRDQLELFWIGWIPDYNDPSNYLNPLLHTNGGSNGAQFSNATVDAMLEEALEETDATAREAIYEEVQRILVEEEMPWVFGTTGDNWDAFRGVKGFPSNAMGKYYFAPVEWGFIPTEELAIPNEPESGGGIPGYTISILTVFSLAACFYIIIALKKKLH